MTSPTKLIAMAGLGLAVALAGCAPAPTDAEPTSTFSSEAEAFAAAEATYREYVKALNQVDLSDPETFEDVYAWTTGDANAGAREAFSQMHADRWVVAGPTIATLVEPSTEHHTEDAYPVAIAVCLDVSGVTLVDEAGRSVVDADRRDIQSMLVSMASDGTSPTGLRISNIAGREGSPQCVA